LTLTFYQHWHFTFCQNDAVMFLVFLPLSSITSQTTLFCVYIHVL